MLTCPKAEGKRESGGFISQSDAGSSVSAAEGGGNFAKYGSSDTVHLSLQHSAVYAAFHYVVPFDLLHGFKSTVNLL